MKPALLFALLSPLMSNAADYSAERITVDGIEVIRLQDAARQAEVLVAPSIGNNAYQMKVKGKPVFWFPFASLTDWKAKPAQAGNPFLAPWANRIDGNAYYANGKKYLLNPDLANFRKDSFQQPIHGLLLYADSWKVVSANADARSAWVTSRLEFWRNPDWMAQFPFAHNIEMTYRLQEGTLEVETALENVSTQTMPVSLGYHTYYEVTDAPRDQWKVHMPVRGHAVLSKELLPTGEIRPAKFADPVSLSGTQLDDVFVNLARDAKGRAEFWVQGKSEKISVHFGPKYPVAVVYAPQGRNFICFEPMTGLTNAFNLAHRQTYNELQTVPAGAHWRESFWITPSGF